MKKSVLFLLMVVFLVYPVLSLDISDANLIWNNKSVEYYSNNNPLVVDLELNIVADTIDNLKFDISGLNNAYTYNSLTRDYDSLDVSKALCESSNGVHTCLLRNIILRTDSSENMIFVKKEDSSSSINISLKQSTANPKVSFIGTDACNQDVCYGKSGYNFIKLEFENSDAGFSRGLINFKLGNVQGNIVNCEDNSCTGRVNIQCNDGDELFFSLTPYRGRQSSDDAGRIITSGDVFSLICDSSSPVVNDLSIVNSRDVGVTPISEPFRVVANVTDTNSPIVKMKVIGEVISADNVSVDCVKRDNIFQCSASVTSGILVKGKYDVPIIFYDLAGNEVSKSIQVELVEVDRESTPNFWNVGNVVQSSTNMNVRNLAYERRFYVEIPLQGNADLLNVNSRTGSCIPTEINKTGSVGDISNFDILNFDKDSNKVYLRMALRPTGLTNVNHRYSNFKKIEYDCELEVQSKKGGYFYSEPEILSFKISINLDDRDTLSDHVIREIESTKKNVERSQLFFQKYEQSLNGAMSICSSIGAIDSVGALLTLSGTSVSGVGSFFGSPELGRPLVTAGDKINVVDKEFMKPLLNACAYLSCQKTLSEGVVGFDLMGEMDSLFPHSEIISGWLGRSDQSDFYDPYKSKYVAYATQCIPAIIHHHKVKQSIECVYLDCITTGMTNYGQSISYCESERSYSRCVFEAQNVLDAVPVVNMFRDASVRFSDVTSSYENLIGFTFPLACSLLGDAAPSIAKGACLIPVYAQSVGKLLTTFRAVVEQAKSLGKVNPTPHCSAALSAADSVIASRYSLDKPVGNYPEEFTFEFEKEIASNMFVKYDDDISDFVVTKRSDKGDEVIGVVSSSDLKFVDGELVINEFNMYDPKGKLLGAIDNKGFTASKSKEYIKLENQQKNRKQELNEISLAIKDIEDNGEDGEPNNLENYNKNIDKEKELENDIKNIGTELENHVLKDLKLISDDASVASSLFSNSVEGNDKKFNALVSRYRKFEDHFIKEWEASVTYSSVKEKNEPVIDVIKNAASSISVFEKNKEFDDKYIKDLEASYENDCGGDKSSLRRCRNDKAAIESGKMIIDVCKDELPSGVPCNKANLNSFSKNLSKDIRVAKSNYSRAQLKNNIDTKFDDYMGDFNKAIKTAWGASHGMTLIKNLGSSLRGEESSGFDGALGDVSNWFSEVGSGDWGICDGKLQSHVGETSGVAVKAGEAGHRAGVYLVGRKSALQNPYGDNSYYDYWLEGNIITSKGGDLGFKIFMYDSKGRVDVTDMVVSDPIVRVGVPKRIGGLGSSKMFTHENDFNKICLEFSTSNLNNYFDVVQTNNNNICQNLRRE